MSVTAIKPKACKNCEHWDKIEQGNRGICDLAYASKPVATNPDGFQVIAWLEMSSPLETGPDFYCCHFKEKAEI